MSVQLQHCEQHFNQQSTRSSSLSWCAVHDSLVNSDCDGCPNCQTNEGDGEDEDALQMDYLYLTPLSILTQIYEHKEGPVRIISWVSCSREFKVFRMTDNVFPGAKYALQGATLSKHSCILKWKCTTVPKDYARFRDIPKLCLLTHMQRSEKNTTVRKTTCLLAFTAQTSPLLPANISLHASGAPQSLCRLTT